MAASSISSRVAPIWNPTELICSSSSHGKITKRLVIRNLLNESILVKLVLSEEAERFMNLDHHQICISGKSIAHVELTIHANRGHALSNVGHQLCGYIRVLDLNRVNEMNMWLNGPGQETRRQLAFALNIHFTNEFSAFETIIDLPGQALVLEPKQGVPGVDDRDTTTAVSIEADCHTAKNCDSIAEYIKEVKARQLKLAVPKKSREEAEWGIYDMASNVIECMKSWYERKPIEKQRISQQKQLTPLLQKKKVYPLNNYPKKGEPSTNPKQPEKTVVNGVIMEATNGHIKAKAVEIESEYVNHEMNATPCGGN